MEKLVHIKINNITLEGILGVPEKPRGIVIFAHGSGSSRFSPRNSFVAKKLRENSLATLLFDLLTEEEDMYYLNRFNIDLLMNRLILVTKWIQENEDVKNLPIGYFGASTGAAAALNAAAKLKQEIKTVVSRGGRPDLSGNLLNGVESSVLLIVGGDDNVVIELNRKALMELNCKKELKIIPGASHLFEEQGTLEQVADLSAEWFKKELYK